MANLEHAEDDQQHVKMSGEISTAGAAITPAAVSSGPGGYTVSCCIPSFTAASELMSTPYSCLVMDARRRHIALPPKYLDKKRTGIREELDTELLRFSESLQGVPLAYDDIKIVGQLGNIYDDSGYIHMDIEANFVVFQPVKRERLLGIVNKLGASHVGCVVHGCFNASIPKPNLVTVQTWGLAGPRIGSELEFEVTGLDADVVGVLLIRGRLDRTRVQELLAIGESSKSGTPTDQPEEEEETEPNPEPEPEPEPPVESPVDTPKKKKKKKKDKVKEEETEEAVTNAPSCQPDGDTTSELNGTTNEANGEEAAKKKKKKSKKEKHLKEEQEEVELSHTEVHGSDSSGYLSDKQSKKRKHETATDVTSSLGAEPETPKSKKKRKSNIDQFA